MAAYELVPTDEQGTIDRTTTPTVSRNSPTLYSLRKPLLFIAAFCLTAFASFKAGQWSTERQAIQLEQSATNTSTTLQDIESAKPQLSNNITEMPGNGRYSVG